MLRYLSNISNKIYLPIVYIFAGVLIYFILQAIISKIFYVDLNYIKVSPRRKRTLEGLFKNIVKYVIAVIVLISILNVFAVDTKTLLAGFGILGLVLGFALQDILKDFLSGLFIIFDNKYDVGDVVNINNFRGEVIFLGLKTTRIKSIEGDIKIILNRNVTEVINYSLSNARIQVDVAISTDYDIQEIEDNLQVIIDKIKIKNIIGDITLLGLFKSDMISNTFRIIAHCEPSKYSTIERQLIKELRIAIAKQKIKIISLIGSQL